MVAITPIPVQLRRAAEARAGAAIDAAIAYLDGLELISVPDWADYIDPDTLDILSTQDCVIGQLCWRGVLPWSEFITAIQRLREHFALPVDISSVFWGAAGELPHEYDSQMEADANSITYERQTLIWKDRLAFRRQLWQARLNRFNAFIEIVVVANPG